MILNNLLMVLNLGLRTDKADKVGNFVFATNAWVLGEESAEAFKVDKRSVGDVYHEDRTPIKPL